MARRLADKIAELKAILSGEKPLESIVDTGVNIVCRFGQGRNLLNLGGVFVDMTDEEYTVWEAKGLPIHILKIFRENPLNAPLVEDEVTGVTMPADYLRTEMPIEPSLSPVVFNPANTQEEFDSPVMEPTEPMEPIETDKPQPRSGKLSSWGETWDCADISIYQQSQN